MLSTSFFPQLNISHSAQIQYKPCGWTFKIKELVHPRWPATAAPPLRQGGVTVLLQFSLWLVLFLCRPWGLWAGGLLRDGGDLGGFGPAAGSSRGVRGVGADGASVLQL